MKKNLLLKVLLFSMVLLVASAVPCFAAVHPAVLSADITTATNNFEGTPDSVVVANVTNGDYVSVYTSTAGPAVGGKQATASGSITIPITQLGAKAGKVYVTITDAVYTESPKTGYKAFLAEPTTTAPTTSQITVLNAAYFGNDSVTVTGVSSGDVVTVYSALTNGYVVGSAISTGTSVTVDNLWQLGRIAGKVYVTKTSTGKWESSPRTMASFTGEVSAAPLAANITVTSNVAPVADSVYVGGLAAQTTVKVYDKAIAGTLLGSGSTGTGNSVTLTIAQVGTKGSIFVSATNQNKAESATRTAKSFTAEPVSTAILATTVTVNNMIGTSDTITVTGLAASDVIKAYRTSTATTSVANATASAGTATLTIDLLTSSTGTIYLTKTSSSKAEGPRLTKTFGNDTSTALLSSAITVTNNAYYTTDSVYVTGVVSGDVIKVYAAATGGTPLVTITSTGTTATGTIAQVGTGAGSVYVSITRVNKNESARTTKAFIAEAKGTAPASTAITVTNNTTGTPDTVVVSGLAATDVVNVYSASTGGTLLGTATSSGASATVSITQLGTTAGNVYVSVVRKSANKLESTRTTKAYLAAS